ncbi:MAG: DUF3592 domain-containing protein [Alphaproteobacteria bacterium]
MLRVKMFVLYACMIWGLGLYTHIMEVFVYDKWTHIQGEVTRLVQYYETEKDGDKKPVYDFTVTYTIDGQQKSVEKIGFSGKPKFREGQPYLVRVNPQNIDEVRVTDGGHVTFVWTTVICGGFLFLIGAIGFFADNRRKKRSVE